ncbi:vWA domain-containing protein [Flectobacillus longus]|uniref:vWA domain-containing protein n=1 Tax=Flectobacillus longus TaxID=2984207 RepID=UPI0024B7A4B0|nr:VWA domain-containing protein [Flectobacillus longus]MDI9880238.1 VWA domain-containing protein [Flectobacillus longus]
MIHRKTSLSENIVTFCRFLREHGFSISVQDETTALEALAYISYQNRLDFQTALAITLVKKVQQLEVFNRLFEDYWKELEKALDSKIKDGKSKSNRPIKSEEQAFNSLKSWLNGNRQNKEEQMAAYSPNESFGQKNFANIPSDEIAEMMTSIQTLSRTLARAIARREQATRARKQFHFSRTIRKNMRSGGELIELAFRKPKKNRLKLVLLCDVSKSMDLYSAFFIQFMYAFQKVYQKIETFIFSTQIARITNELNTNHFNEVKANFSEKINIWSGGTKIGQSLAQFNQDFGKRYVNNQTVVIILSDGWETGNPEILSDAMETLHKQAHKILWLNPLAGNPNFQANTVGMQAAMPYINHFAPVHNLESLKQLWKMI